MADEFDPYYTWLGIRPEEQPADHYRLIGLRQFEDHADVISNAVDQKMQFLRTLQVGKRSAISQKLLNEISTAGGVLLDPKKKQIYDADLKSKAAAKQAQASPSKPLPLPQPAPAAPLPAPLPPRPRPMAIPPQPVATGPKVEISAAHASPRPAASWMIPLLVVGGVLAATVVGGVLVFASGMLGTSEKKVAATPAIPPAENKGTKPAPPKPALPVEPEPPKPPQNTTPTTTPGSTNAGTTKPIVPGTKTNPPDSANKAWWKDPQHVGKTLALHLGPESFVEFPDSAGHCTLATPVTAEVWLRLRLQGEQPVQIMGTILGGEGAVPKGWGLFAKRSAGEKAQNQLYLEFWKTGGEFLRYDPVTLPDDGWHHVAVVLEPGKAGKLFLDGKPHAFPPVQEVSSSQRNLVLGSQTQPAEASFSADVCGFRASDSARYREPFAPPSPLELMSEEPTFAVLDGRLYQTGIATAEKPFPWLYGVGKFDQRANKILDFQLMQYGSSRQWQGGTVRPDKKLGWVALDPVGGHPGGPNQLAVRRWIAPAAGELSVSGRLLHTHSMRSGDGVKARIVTSRGGLVDEWRAYFKEVDTAATGIKVQAGDSVDFAVDCDNNFACDAFEWIVELKLVDAEQRVVGTWNSAKDFRVIPNTSAPKTAVREPFRSRAEWIPLENYSAIMGDRDWYGSQEHAKLAVQYAPATSPSTPLVLKPAPAKPPSPFEDPPSPETPTAKKAAPPDAAALAKAKAEVLQVFGDDLKAAKAPKQKQELAQKMLELVKDTTDAATKFSLLEEVRRLAVEGHDTALARQALEKLGEEFEVDLLPKKVKLFEAIAAEGLTPAQRGEAISAVCELGYEALDANQFEQLPAIVAIARGMAVKAAPADAKAEAKEFFDASAKKQKLIDAIKKAEQAIVKAPNEPGANLTLGLYYVFTRGDEKKGLPMLAKGTDQKLAAAAKLCQQNEEKGTAATLEEADAWYDAATSVPADYKVDVQQKALNCYSSLASSGTGLEKVKAEKRRDELAAAVALEPAKNGAKRVRASDIPEFSSGLVGRVFVNGKDAGVLITFLPNRQFNNTALNEILDRTKATSLRVVLEGVITYRNPNPNGISLIHSGKSDGPGQMVSIDGKPLNSVGGTTGRGTAHSQIPLPAGDHLIQWAFDYEKYAQPELRINLVPPLTGSEMQVRHTRKQVLAARKATTSSESSLSY